MNACLRFASLVLGLACSLGANATPIVAVTDSTLLVFDSATPGTVTTTALTGLIAGDTIVGMDRRPATTQVYLLTRSATGTGRLYLLNTVSGAAQFVLTLSADPADVVAPYDSLAGSRFGMDFNPVVDRLRVVSELGENMRVNSGNGLVTTDVELNPAVPEDPDPVVVGSAYVNNVSGADATTLFAIDSTQDTLNIQVPPNNGTISTVGPLGVDAPDTLSFDVAGAPFPQAAFAVMSVGGVTGLYVVNLETGAATLVGPVLGNPAILGMAVSLPQALFGNGFE
jgi:hypothetical protein